jgi:hypothetical protein
MKPLRVEDLRKELRVAIRQSFEAASQEQPLYGFTLALHPLGEHVCAMAQSELALAKMVQSYMKNYRATSGDVGVHLSCELRWCYNEAWPLFNEPYFDATNAVIRECVVRVDSFYELGYTRLVEVTCLGVVAELDVEGAFGTGNARERLVLNRHLFEGMSDAETMRAAVMLNPHEVFKRFHKEYYEGIEAGKCLEYVR